MKALLDACVLFPTVMREVLLGAAAEGAFVPLWSDRILEEFARAVRRLGPDAEPIARAEIAGMRTVFPNAMVVASLETERSLELPDPDDNHVLAAAIAGEADVLVTLNRQDFPDRALALHGIRRRDPDGLLWEIASRNPALMQRVVARVQARAVAASGRPQPIRALLRRAGMPRLGKRAEAEF